MPSTPRQDPDRSRTPRPEVHDVGPDGGEYPPHTPHPSVRSHIVDTLQGVVREIVERRGECRVLEVGARNGMVTDDLVSAGGHPATDGGPVDVVACVAVLQHVPDHLAAVSHWTRRIRTGGAFVSFQDPLWYPRRSRLSLTVDRAARHRSDAVGHHVTRDGVDEMALVDRLTPDFDEVQLRSYWSARGTAAQLLGCLIGSPNTFGVVARHRRVPVPMPRNGRP